MGSKQSQPLAACMRVLFCVGLLVSTAQLSLADEGVNQEYLTSLPSNPFALDEGRSCGPRCVGFLLAFNDKPFSYSDLIEKVPPGPNGTSLSSLDSLIGDCGLYSNPFESADVSDLLQLPKPILLHLKSQVGKGHFVVVTSYNQAESSFECFSPPRRFIKMSRSEISELMTGYGTVVTSSDSYSINHYRSQRRNESIYFIACVAVTVALLHIFVTQIRKTT